jgi:hypothetical protein
MQAIKGDKISEEKDKKTKIISTKQNALRQMPRIV